MNVLKPNRNLVIADDVYTGATVPHLVPVMRAVAWKATTRYSSQVTAKACNASNIIRLNSSSSCMWTSGKAFPLLVIGSNKVAAVIAEHSLRPTTPLYEPLQCHNEHCLATMDYPILLPNLIQQMLSRRLVCRTVVESLQKAIFSIFVISSAVSVPAGCAAKSAPISSSLQIDCAFPATCLHSTMLSFNSRLKYAQAPEASGLASLNTCKKASRTSLS
ncbi:hypothetical protein P5673_019018 [Acropora cervicornis]|uniref:Uncharacterized protein n=1 Tax=Acropora cervicornis TaxID=6130 RepID=A0AAD9QCK5_ACRCE|nr:hypothetical protein P5673_019018 [Acropora cervicornis]